jgi:hypothetical protein
LGRLAQNYLKRYASNGTQQGFYILRLFVKAKTNASWVDLMGDGGLDDCHVSHQCENGADRAKSRPERIPFARGRG